MNEVREFGLKGAITNMLMDSAQAVDAWLGLYSHPEGLRHGFVVYLRIPFTPLSTLMEWHDTSLGLGVERTEEGLNVYLGRLQVNLCHEQGELYRSQSEAL